MLTPDRQHGPRGMSPTAAPAAAAAALHQLPAAAWGSDVAALLPRCLDIAGASGITVRPRGNGSSSRGDGGGNEPHAYSATSATSVSACLAVEESSWPGGGQHPQRQQQQQQGEVEGQVQGHQSTGPSGRRRLEPRGGPSAATGLRYVGNGLGFYYR